jgi:hypothetical protein
MSANQKQMRAEMKAAISVNQEQTRAEMEAAVRAGQDETKTLISSIPFARTEFSETIGKKGKGALASVDQQTRSLRKDLQGEIQGTQLDIQATKMLVEGTWWEFETKLEMVEARAGVEVAATLTGANGVKPGVAGHHNCGLLNV